VASELFNADRREHRYEEINCSYTQLFANTSKVLSASHSKYTDSQLEIPYWLIFLRAINPMFLTNRINTRQAMYV